MPFDFDSALCDACLGECRCVEDRRDNPVRGRTAFRILQNNAIKCTFGDFVPGFEDGENQSFDFYLSRWRDNVRQAAEHLFGAGEALTHSQIAKCEGDVLQLLLAGALWNAAADWNRLMATGDTEPGAVDFPGAVPCPDRKVAIVGIPRGYDVTRLFTPEVRQKIHAFNNALQLRDMELHLSAPDVVGVRLPEPLPREMQQFAERISDLGRASRERAERAYQVLEGRVEAPGFLFAIAVKKSVRSDRLYQPLFEANVLKFLVEEVLRGAALRFIVYVADLRGAAVERHYKAASLFSLLRGGQAERAVDALVTLTSPMEAAEVVARELPLFPI